MNTLILLISLLGCNRLLNLHSGLKVHYNLDICRETNQPLVSKLKKRENDIILNIEHMKNRDDEATKLILLFNSNMKEFIEIMIAFTSETSINMINLIGDTSIEWNVMRYKFQNIFFYREFSSLENLIYVLEEKKAIILEFENKQKKMVKKNMIGESNRIDELISHLNLNVEELIKITIDSIKNNLIENSVLTTSAFKAVFSKSFNLLKAILESNKIDLNYYRYDDNKSLLEIFLEDIKHYYNRDEQSDILTLIIKIVEKANIEKAILDRALFYAIDLNSLDLVKVLISKNANIDKVIKVCFRKYDDSKPGFITIEDKSLIAFNYSSKSPKIYDYLKSLKY